MEARASGNSASCLRKEEYMLSPFWQILALQTSPITVFIWWLTINNNPKKQHDESELVSTSDNNNVIWWTSIEGSFPFRKPAYTTLFSDMASPHLYSTKRNSNYSLFFGKENLRWWFPGVQPQTKYICQAGNKAWGSLFHFPVKYCYEYYSLLEHDCFW